MRTRFMRYPKPAHLFIGACTAVLLGVLMLRLRPNGEGDQSATPFAESSGDRAKSDVSGSEASRSRDRAAKLLAESSGRPQAVPTGVAPKVSATRRDELLGLLDASEAGAQLDRDRLGTILRAAATELGDTERAEVIGKAGSLVAHRNLEWGVELASRLEDFRDRHSFVKALIEAAVDEDPVRVATWAAELADLPLRDSAYTTIGMEWAKSDLTAALAWAQGLPEVASRLSAFEGLTWTWAQRDPKAVYEWAAGIAEADVRSQVFVKIAKMIAVQDPPHALGWALQFPEGPGREHALNYAVFQWASRDLAAATGWAASVPDASLRANSEVAIARSWSVQEAQGATAWAAGIPDPDGRTAALKTTLLKWAEVNPAAAAQWIGQRGATEANEEIFKSVTSGLSGAQPAVRELWLNSTTHPGWRAAGEQILRNTQDDSRRKGARPKS